MSVKKTFSQASHLAATGSWRSETSRAIHYTLEHVYGLPFFCSFIAAILALRSSRLLVISSSFSSLLIFARLGAAGGGVAVERGVSSGSSQPSDTGGGAGGGVAVDTFAAAKGEGPCFGLAVVAELELDGVGFAVPLLLGGWT